MILHASTDDVIAHFSQYPDDNDLTLLLVQHLERIHDPKLWEYAIEARDGTTRKEKERLFLIACRQGNIELAQWMSHRNRQSKGVSPRCHDDMAIIWACVGHHDRLIHWLLTSPDVVETIPLTAQNQYFEHWCHQHNRLDLYVFVQSHLPGSSYSEIDLNLF